jgi:hypothetical protein
MDEKIPMQYPQHFLPQSNNVNIGLPAGKWVNSAGDLTPFLTH